MGTYSRLCEKWANRYTSVYENFSYTYTKYILKLDSITNVETLGQVLYTYYAFFY